MSRTAQRFLSSSLRSSALANFKVAARSPRAALTRRMMSSESHASHGGASSDTPWMIGSALVFGPLFLYLVSPTARNVSHGHADHGHQSHTNKNEDEHAQQVESSPEEAAVPTTDDEDTEVPAQEVKESMARAFETDSPKDAQEQEVVLAMVDTTPESSAVEQQSQEEAPRDAAPSEPERNPTPAVPAAIEGATPATSTSDEKTQGTASEQLEA
ncbi:hypothetical protein JVU11DRAFT_3529 [Chiua virens]|nr:hypothetical protein JVU11DRAFT_3529 [Chiua virens]